jgi:hypothetical protein
MNVTHEKDKIVYFRCYKIMDTETAKISIHIRRSKFERIYMEFKCSYKKCNGKYKRGICPFYDTYFIEKKDAI